MKQQVSNTNTMALTAFTVAYTSLQTQEEVVTQKHSYLKPEIQVTYLQTENGFANGSVTFLNGIDNIEVNEWELGSESSKDIYF